MAEAVDLLHGAEDAAALDLDAPRAAVEARPHIQRDREEDEPEERDEADHHGAHEPRHRHPVREERPAHAAGEEKDDRPKAPRGFLDDEQVRRFLCDAHEREATAQSRRRG